MTDKATATSEAVLGTATEGSTARTEAPTLTAGRALDIAIAEKVMGCEVWRTPAVCGTGEDCFLVIDGGTDYAPEYEIPKYSTDIAAAMQVAAKLRAQGWVYLTLQSFTLDADAFYWNDNTMKVEWWAEFSRYRSLVEVQSDACASPSLAICLAALKAVSVLSQTEEGK